MSWPMVCLYSPYTRIHFSIFKKNLVAMSKADPDKMEIAEIDNNPSPGNL